MAQRFAEALATLLVVLLSAAATYGAVALFAHLAGAGQCARRALAQSSNGYTLAQPQPPHAGAALGM